MIGRIFGLDELFIDMDTICWVVNSNLWNGKLFHLENKI